MEVKTKRIILGVVNTVLLLAVIVGTFFLSVWAGICTILFGTCGYIMGYYNRHARALSKFYEELLKHDTDVMNGKTLNITENENGDVKIFVTEKSKPIKKDKK